MLDVFRTKTLVAPLFGPLRNFTHAMPMTKISWNSLNMQLAIINSKFYIRLEALIMDGE